MNDRLQATAIGVVIGVAAMIAVGAILVAAVVVGGMAVWRTSVPVPRGVPAGRIQLDLTEQSHVDPKWIGYRQTGEFPTAMAKVRAVATGPGDRVYVAGDRTIRVFDPDGKKLSEMAVDGEPSCLAVGLAGHAFPGRIYAGVGDHVEVFDPQGKPAGAWESLGEKALLTSIALAEEDVYVADAGNRIVLRCGTGGKLLGRIGRRDPDRNIPGFVITSPYFDLAVAPDGLLRVVNPRALRIETYTPEGDLLAHWGAGSPRLDGFFGCCNPANIAVLPDGRIVTAEKGLPRVKVYSKQGKLECVVADPATLAGSEAAIADPRAEHQLGVYDVAADSRGRVLVLDPKARSVRVFEPNKKESEKTSQ